MGPTNTHQRTENICRAARGSLGALPAGSRVGLFGGSFDPPHPGHQQLSREALKRFGLDRIIWLVSPGNPLKSDPQATMSERVRACQSLITHPRIMASPVEAEMETRFTADTLKGISSAFPKVQFVWLMGADSLQKFHLWNRWRDILATMPMGIMARPGYRMTARMSITAKAYRSARLPDKQSRLLPHYKTPVWCFANMPLRPESSTQIRARDGALRSP